MNLDLQYIEFDTFSPLSILSEFENDDSDNALESDPIITNNKSNNHSFEFFFDSNSSSEEDFQKFNFNNNSSNNNSSGSSNDNSSADEEEYTVNQYQHHGLYQQQHQHNYQQQQQKESKPRKKYTKSTKEGKVKVGPKKQKLDSNITKRPKLTNANHQCQGINRKKNSQCRNAALMMEGGGITGPRPQYCAEHIELDSNGIYRKCTAIQNSKGCKEVVLKEFGICFKHVHLVLENMSQIEIRAFYERVGEILHHLQEEAREAKTTDQDMFQRKNKLIPKYVEMHNIISSFLV